MKTDEATVLIVEDEKDVREPLAEYLRSQGLSVTTAPDGSIAVEKLDATPFDLVLTDIQMPEMNGMELLRHVRIKYPSIPVIMFTAFGTIKDAVDTIRLGAYDYVLKPLVFEDILQKIRGAIEFKHSELRDDPSGVSDDRPLGLDAIIGSSPPFQRLKEQIQKVADGDVSVVIQGPSGTGKELVARALHYLSRRRKQPFVAVNCAAIPESLLESSFFGHTKGAFTGAISDKKGLFLSADHGTLFLDEVSELPINLQAKLLRVIEEREVTPVGLTEPVPVDVTMISASAQRLKSIVESGAFREDLYFRLNVIELDMPTLQQRREDIPELARHFLERVVRRISTTVTGFSTDAISALMQYAWPGNIRELRNVVERAVVLCSSNEILPTDLPHEIADCGPTSELSEDHKSVMRNYERDLILKALQSADGDKKTAAKLLGMGLSTLYRKLEEFGIE